MADGSTHATEGSCQSGRLTGKVPGVTHRPCIWAHGQGPTQCSSAPAHLDFTKQCTCSDPAVAPCHATLSDPCMTHSHTQTNKYTQTDTDMQKVQGDGVVRQHDEKGKEGGQERGQCLCVCVCDFLLRRKGKTPASPSWLWLLHFRVPSHPPVPRPPGGRLRETGTRPVAVPGGRLRETGTLQGWLSLSVDAPPRSGSRTLPLASFFVLATFVELFGVGSVDDDAACHI